MTSADTDETTVPTHLSSEHRSVVSFASEKTDRQSISDDDDDDEDNNSLGDLDEEDAMRVRVTYAAFSYRGALLRLASICEEKRIPSRFRGRRTLQSRGRRRFRRRTIRCLF